MKCQVRHQSMRSRRRAAQPTPPAGFLRPAFTVVELLVSMAVLGALVALTLPAVQAVRETARNLRCVNHLKQLGLAMQNYESAHRVFPTKMNTLRRLAPYLESDNPDARESIPVFVCPTDARSVSNPDRGISYLLNHGTTWPLDDSNGFAVDVLFGPQEARPADFSDGLSNTACMSERLISSKTLDYDATEAELRSDPKRFLWFTPDQHPTIPQLIDNCRNRRISPYPFHISPSGGSWRSWNVCGGYTHVLPPNVPGCRSGPPSRQQPWGSFVTATSQHSGHVNVLMGDGSVRGVADSISLQIWSAIGTRNGHESVEAL